MYWCQLWKKIHKPLIALAVIGFVIVTATQTEIEFDESDAHRNNRIDTLSDDDILIKSATPSGSNNNPQQLPKHEDLPTIPVSPVPQLPHCRGGQDKIPYKSDERNNLHRDNGNLSEEIVVSPTRGLSSVVNERHVLVATLDGQLSLLDQGGRILWSIATGQIFSSTISSLQLNENGKWINLIPSLTGGLYKYDGISLHPMPLSAETLLRRSFRLTSDVVMTGGKELRTFGIDLSTGAVRYECGMEGCATQTKAESQPEEDVVLVVKKQLQTVRAIDSATGSERWNFSVATHELALAGVTEGCYEGEQKDSGHDNLLKVVIPEGLIIGADKSSHAVWQHKFSSPISQAWVLEDGMLRVIDPIKNSPRIEDSPALYIGIHKQQFYVQESHATAERLENAFELQFSHKGRSQRPIEIGWKPSSGITGMTDSKAVAPYQPEFSGFYVLEKEEMKSSLPAIEPGKESSVDNDSDGEGEDLGNNGDEFGFTEGAVQIIFVSLWFWWKEVLGISLLTAVVLNLVLMRPVIRAVRTQTVREMWGFFRNFRNQQQEERALLPRKESDTLELPFTHRTRTRTTSSSSNASQLGIGEDPNAFKSQYLEEFKPIQCLGRGGFGVVFEAKKIIDDRNYAVKRIPLPNREKSRDKVMREVKALAKLDHRNIVRYFNAWIEKPPLGWLEQHDPLWLESKTDASSSNFLSSFEMASKTDNGFVALRERGNKKEYSLISIPSKTPEEPTDPDDSFIVFAADGDESVDVDNNSFSKCALKMIEASGGWDSSSYAIERASSTSLHESSRVCDSYIASVSGGRGFFARPTSLDIPSMKEESGSQNADSGEADESIEEGIDVANNASYTPSIMYLYIQQELCQKRTLQEWLRVTKERNLLQVVSFFVQTVEAVEYIHLNKLIHRDLKPGNIFLASGVESEFGSSSKERITVKIGDFGLATTASNRFDADTHTPAGDIPATKANLTGHVGTHLYMSPEQNRNKPYDFKVDIYSLGLIFFELLVPFSTEMERYESLSRVRKMSFPPTFLVEHQAEYEFISKMVSHDPEERPNATVIKKWLKSHLPNVSPSDSCSPSASRGLVHPKSLSADFDVFPVKKGRFMNEQERVLNKAQSCM